MHKEGFSTDNPAVMKMVLDDAVELFRIRNSAKR
jgi:hypothetical protein